MESLHTQVVAHDDIHATHCGSADQDATNGVELNCSFQDGDVDGSNVKERSSQHDKMEAIAIVGMALRFPQDATSVEKFWELLLNGQNTMTKIPGDRFTKEAFCRIGRKGPGLV